MLLKYLSTLYHLCQLPLSQIFTLLSRFREEVYFNMRYKYNVSCSETVSKNWTRTAFDCYLIGCTCHKCNLNKIYFLENDFKCKMKDTVIELVRKHGIPKEVYYD